nr:MAG TPA: hypothetical protein [Caudoviricetes sp.]
MKRLTKSKKIFNYRHRYSFGSAEQPGHTLRGD